MIDHDKKMVPRDPASEIPLHVGQRLLHPHGGGVHVVTKLEDVGNEELGQRVLLDGPRTEVAWQRAISTRNGWSIAPKPGYYANPKVNDLLAHVGEFTPRDFLAAAQAMLDQACRRQTVVFNRAWKAVEELIESETPEDETVN